jgi:hypothetical protein
MNNLIDDENLNTEKTAHLHIKLLLLHLRLNY